MRLIAPDLKPAWLDVDKEQVVIFAGHVGDTGGMAVDR